VRNGGWLTLSQLAGLVRAEIEAWSSRTGDVLVVAEISDLRRGPTGHWFAKLVERRNEGVVAEMQAVIWVRQAGILDAFRAVTGVVLASGMEVLLNGSVGFHERYGLRFDIHGIDPTYTMGEMQRRRREVIERLTREGLMNLNKALAMPIVPQRIAIVSSDGAAGFGDFVHQLDANPYGYGFGHALFAALMQGDGAGMSIAGAFDRVRAAAERYDVAVVIRGGGSQVDLSCFDTYEAGAAIARCPLPVITGVGHERDETVADMVANARAKTPTAAAQMLITAVRSFEERVEDLWADLCRSVRDGLTVAAANQATASARLNRCAQELVSQERARTSSAMMRLAGSTMGVLRTRQANLETDARSLWMRAQSGIGLAEAGLANRRLLLELRGRARRDEQDARLDGLERSLHLLDPACILKRGFSITRLGGQTLTSDDGLLLGDELVTTLARGRVMSRVYEVGGSDETR